MPAILRRFPFFDEVTSVESQGSRHRILPLQIVVWVSLGPKGVPGLARRTPRFPAILDPAFTDTFLIHQEQLRRLAGLQPEHLRQRGEFLRTHERAIPLHSANVWLYRNQPGQRDQFTDDPPVLLELHRGIGITSGAELYPRLPLLGARAFRGARLRLSIDYARCNVSLRTPPKFWFFG